MIGLALAALMDVAGPASSSTIAEPKRFTLTCESQNPKAPSHRFVADVNVELRSYFTEVGGLGEIVKADRDRIVFMKWSPFEGTYMGTAEEYDRASGFWYFTVGPDLRHHAEAKPDAICTMEPARANFRADQRYAPNK